ncbi:MAG: ABC transporter permease YtrF precursor [candidate division WS2 bacterium ADurb.Bin280]|uniref:ABC transporter permease YtrF n=1 Tax=candidate division WS2 bacterium ADurb.Bin280 TaxID=1852829 RepID=A0A1V5SFJ2_9BACT|nr:MAG: ABC transporter permease YtrF precursor [candidate division WS2 bacterium ADurb.Bin280]
MDNKFLFRLASKNLFGHRLRTFLTVTAMIIGVGAIVFLVGFAFGIQKLVESEVTGANAYELIDIGTGNSQIIKLDKSSAEKISAISGVESVEVIVNAAGKTKDLNEQEIDLAFFGTTKNYLEWSSQNKFAGDSLSQASSLSDAGNFNPNEKSVLVNESLSEKLGVAQDKLIGSKILLDIIITKELTSDNKSQTYLDQEFTISGIIRDNGTPSAFTNLQILEDYGASGYSQAKIKTKQPQEVEVIRKQVENLGFKTQYVGETIDQVNQVFNFFKIILGSFGMIAMIVAILGMFNTLTISLLERTKEIALLKILGMRKKDIRKSFLLEAGLISSIGALAGILLGFAIGILINNILNQYATKSGGEPISMFYYPWWFVTGVFAITFLIGIFTGLYPAQRAAKINALDVLRYE